MVIFDGAPWLSGDLLFILIVLCVIVTLYATILVVTNGVVEKNNLSRGYLDICFVRKVCLFVFVLCSFGYGYYKYIEWRTMEKNKHLREMHEQCFANCHSENFYLDLFTLQDFHNNVIWNDSTNNGNEKVYKTYFYPKDGNREGVEIKSSFNKIYYYSYYEIFMDDYNKNFFEENGFIKIEEDVTENEYVEPQTAEQVIAKAMRDFDKEITHLYKKDNITIKIKLCYVSGCEYSSCPMCKVEVYNNKMEHLINII